MCNEYKINGPTVEVKRRRLTEESCTKKIEDREAKVRENSVFPNDLIALEAEPRKRVS